MNGSDVNSVVNGSGVPATRVLNVPVSTINMTTATSLILGWVRQAASHYVCVRDVHGIMRAQEDSKLMAIHEQASMVTPDGMPLVWLARWRGHSAVDRVCGADLVDALCDASQAAGVRHYFFGGKPGVADRMAAALKERYPELQIAGTNTPPFHALTEEEDAATTEGIAATLPGVVWVGLSTPKQEFWMRDHVGRIPGATLVGVGAAFDFFAGDVKRAPAWMHRRGVEWLHRLLSEPRRLWRRYLVLAPKFVWLAFRAERQGVRRSG